MTGILFEPFKIKVVEALPLSTQDERAEWIAAAGYNVFSLTSNQVLIDLLTDSGTAAMSDLQWSEMLKADESYAGSRSFIELEATARELTGMKHILPVHQGRAAEHLLFESLLTPGDIVPSNSHFDTTLANIEACGANGINLLCVEAKDPFKDAPFKGNVDLAALEAFLAKEHSRVPFVMMTITNNTGGGQPVSYENLAEAAALARKYNKPFILDACRFAENAYFIKCRERSGQFPFTDMSVMEIAQKCFALADAITFSGKKDALVNIGGLLCVRSDTVADALKNTMLIVEGFPTYGGLAGYSLAAMNQGLKEVVDERYLAYRLRTISWMVERLAAHGIPVLQPAGGHAVYIEAAQFYAHLPRETLPGIALTTELYIAGGIRGCELGTVAFGKRTAEGKQVFPPLDLVRLAIPRRVYTEAHMGYVVEVLCELYDRKKEVAGFEFLEEYPVMRHFRSRFKRME